MKKFAGFMLTLFLLMAVFSAFVPQLAAAEEFKPVLTVSFAGYEEVRANVEGIGKLGGNPQLSQFLEGMVNMMTQNKVLSNIDKNAPWGALVQLVDQGEPNVIGFAPITDLKQMVEVLKATPFGGKIQESDGIYQLDAPNGKSLFLAQKGQVVAFVEDKGLLEEVPADPAKLLGDLPKKYLLAVRVNLKNIPETLREQYLGMFSMMSQMGVQREDDETDEQFARRESSAKRSMEQFEMIAKETEQITIGTTIDRKSNKIVLDFEIVADEGSKLAGELTKGKPGKSNFAGFDLPGAAVVANSLGTMSDQDVTDAKENLRLLGDRMLLQLGKQDLTETQVALVKEMLQDALNIADKNLETKKTDAGFALCLEPTAVTMLAGAAVVDGKPIENLIKKFFDAAKEEEPSVAEMVKFNAETYKGIRFHTLAIPAAMIGEEIKPFVGDNLDVVLGVGDKQVFVAVGRDAANVLKKAIDKCQTAAGTEVQAFQMSVSALQIAKFVAEVVPEEEVKAGAQKFIEMLEKSEGKDHLIVTSQSITNGVRIRLELEEGFLKSFSGYLVPMMGGMGGMPGPGGPEMPPPSTPTPN